MSAHVAVIGGGISGLASAVRLLDRGFRVQLFEGERDLGGLAGTFPYQGGHLERFYHCILPSDRALIAWIHELGLGSELLWRRTRMGFLYRRRLHPLNTPWDLLSFSPLTLPERVRMGLIAIAARRRGMDPALDRVSAADWVRGMAGDRAFEILWKPLLSAKIGDRYPELPALWLASRLHREKNTGPETKGCLRRGYRSLIDAFAARLAAGGATVRCGTRVDAIERDGEALALRLSDGSRETFDTVVATSPLVQFQAMTRGLGLDPAIAHLPLDYQGVISGVFVLDRALSPNYWTPFVDSGATAQGVIEMSNLVPLERTHGRHVVYFAHYAHRSSAIFAKPDDELRRLFRADLEALYPDRTPEVLDAFLFRAPFVEPIWPLGYSRLRPPTSVIPGRLYLVCTAQVYPHVNSWNSCCEVVERMIPELTAQTAERAARPRAASA